MATNAAATPGNKGGTTQGNGKKSSVKNKTTTYVPPSKPAPEIRADIRDYIKNERDTILRRWQSLQEALNSENRIRDEFVNKIEATKLKTLPPVISKFIRTLKRAVRKTMVVKGGTPFSIIRSMFLYWDKDKSGELGDDELECCMNSLGVKIEKNDREAIIRHYDSGKGTGEMAYSELLEDIKLEEPTLTMTMELTSNSPKDDDNRFKSADDKFAVMPPLVVSFIDAVRSVLKRKMAIEGGTELSHLRYSFLMFDHDYSNALDEEELTSAMHKNMGLQISREQATEVVSFYDRKGTGQMNYHLLLQDVMKGQPLMLQHPEVSARSLANTRKNLESNPFIIKPFDAIPNKRMEQFKRNLITVLNQKIKYEGGSIRSRVRNAFTQWDPKFLGKIYRWEDLQGAIRLLSLNISEDEARNIISIYDVNRNGEMDYRIFLEDLVKDDYNLLVETDAAKTFLSSSATSRCPGDVSLTIRKFRRAAEIYAKKSENSIQPKDLLHGTFLRFDSSRSGRISCDDLLKVAREIKVVMTSDEETTKLISWFDSNGSGRMDYSLLVRQLFGDDVLTRNLSLPPMKESHSKLDIKETNGVKVKQAQARNRLIIAEKVKLTQKLKAIEMQKQAILENRKVNK